MMMKKEDVTTSQSDASYRSQTRLHELDHNGGLPLSDPLYRLSTILEPKVYPWPNTSKIHLLTDYVNDCTKHSTTNNYFTDFNCMNDRIHDSFKQNCKTDDKRLMGPTTLRTGKRFKFLIHQIRGSHHVIISPRRTEIATTCATLQQDWSMITVEGCTRQWGVCCSTAAGM